MIASDRMRSYEADSIILLRPSGCLTANPKYTLTLFSIGFDWGNLDPEPAPVPEVPPPPPDPVVEDKPPVDDFFSSFGKKDKKGKKGSKVVEETAPPPDIPETLPATIDEPPADDFMSSWTTGTKVSPYSIHSSSGADQCTQKHLLIDPVPLQKKGTKSKSKGISEIAAEPSPDASIMLPESIQEKSAEEDPWSSAGLVSCGRFKLFFKSCTYFETMADP